jgi:xylulokinase
MEYLLAYDVGTSGTKAALVTTDGRVVATAYDPYSVTYPRPLWAEQNPEDWWRAVGVTTRRVLEAGHIRPSDVASLSASTQMINLIPVDANGRPLMPCVSWLDGRAGEEAHRIVRMLGGPAVFAMIVGVVLTGKDLLPKYLWLKRHVPDVYREAAAFIDASGYLLHRLTGRMVSEWSVASVTGLFNLKSKTWDTGLMRVFGVDRAKYPELVRSVDKVGGLRREAAAHLGLVEGTPVFGGAGDAMAAAVGSGAVGEGEGHICLGTSGFVGIVTSRRVTGKRGIPTIQSADPAKLLLISEMETCGACLKWAARELYGADDSPAAYARMDDDVAGTPPGAGRLLFSPWMYGERSPVADETLRSSFINLGTNHTRPQMARAIYEGVAYNLRWMVESISELFGFRPDPLRVMGGGARGRPWLRIVADITGRRLETIAHPQEAAAVGAALLGAVGLGLYPSVESLKSLVQAESVIEPDASHAATYDELYRAYKEIYRSLRGLYHELNKLAP